MTGARDKELDAALDSFVVWARERGVEGCAELPPSSDSSDFGSGSVLGDFELVRRIGVGGMGVVFEARQRSVAGRRVAVKILRQLVASEELALRFRREVAAIGELDHPAIVPILNAQVEAGTPFYAMKLIRGLSAAQLIRELKLEPELPRTTELARARLSETEDESSAASRAGIGWEPDWSRWVARLGLELAEALQAACDRGLVHRDVKPANVMLTALGRPVLLDFGLAAAVGAEPLTSSGALLGTLPYSAPEQVRGEQVDSRADVYSLGATLYELLTLRRVHEARTHSELLRQIDSDDSPVFPDSIPVDVQTICCCALARLPTKRYSTPNAMAADLKAFLAGRPISARPPGALERVTRFLRKHPRLATVLVGVLLVAFIVRARDYTRAFGDVSDGERMLAQHLEDQQALLDDLARFQGGGLTFAERDRLRARIRQEQRLLADDYRETRESLQDAFLWVANFTPARERLAELHASELRMALKFSLDVTDRDAVTRIESALARDDEKERFAHLQRRTGRVRIETRPPGASIEVWPAGDGKRVASGTTPFEESALLEGSYLAVIHSPGHAESRFPFLVRRDAVYADGFGVPPRAHNVELTPAETVPPGAVPIPAGWTLLEDAPPCWGFVEMFLMSRLEVTNGDVLRWIAKSGELAAIDPFSLFDESPGPGYVPRFLEDAPKLHLDRAEDGRSWHIAERSGHRLDQPVRGLTRMEMLTYAQWLAVLEPTSPPGWYASLPTTAEWMRAARGADGRRYPWGNDFSWSRVSGFDPAEPAKRSAQLKAAGSSPLGRSPFQIEDMSGSIAEATLSPFGPLRGHYALCGGSYQSHDSSSLAVNARQDSANEPRPHAGFRLIWRRLPPLLTEPDQAPTTFRDDFDVEDTTEVDGWEEMTGNPLDLAMSVDEHEDCSVREGHLVCRGGEGNASTYSTAWRRIHVASEFTITAQIRGSASMPASTPDGARRLFGISLVRGFLPGDDDYIQLGVRFDGYPVLQSGGSLQPPREDIGEIMDLELPILFELRVHGNLVEGRVWPIGTERPGEPLRLLQQPGSPPPRFLGLAATNLIGGMIEVDWVSVAPGRP